MGRFWSLLFLMVPVFGVGIFVWAMAGWWPMRGHWLPENINAHGGVIDSLFMFILVLTGVIFIATTMVMFWFMWRYDAGANPLRSSACAGYRRLRGGVRSSQSSRVGSVDRVNSGKTRAAVAHPERTGGRCDQAPGINQAGIDEIGGRSCRCRRVRNQVMDEVAGGRGQHMCRKCENDSD